MRHERHGKYHYCSHCDYFTRKSNTLSMHIALKHSEHTPHKCRQCPEWFKTKSQLNHHVLSRHTESLIQCTHIGCEERFKNHNNYHIHWIRKHDDIHRYMKKFEGKDWECLTCGKIQPKNSLSYHVVQCSPCSPFSKEAKTRDISIDPLDDDLFVDIEKPDSCTPGFEMVHHTYSALREGQESYEDIPINAMDSMLESILDLELDMDFV